MGKDLKGKYRARITLFNMLNYAYQNDVIMKNSCNGMVNSDIGRSTQKKEALTLEQQKGNAGQKQHV